MTSKGAFLKQKIFFAFTRPIFYAAAILLNVFCSFHFFFLQNFFAGSGTTDLHYFFLVVPYISIIVIPVLSLGIGRKYEEVFPFTDFFIIFSDFLTVFLQFVAMAAPLLFTPLCVNLFGDVDAGQVFTSLFLIVLYGMASSSLCVCAQSFFTSKTVSFLISTVFLAITNSIHLISYHIATSSVLMAAVKFFSFSWHFDRASKGILDTRDVVYFLAMAVFFLFIAYFSIENKKRRVFTSKQKTSIVAYSLVFLLCILNATRYFCRVDLTRDKKFSLSDYSKRLVESAEDIISITYYRSPALSSLYPQVRDIYDILLEYSSSKWVSVMEIAPEKTNAVSLLENYGISPRQIQTSGNNSVEFKNVYSSIVIEYNGKWEIIPFILSSETLEYDLDGRIAHLLTEKARYVNIVCGNGMSLQDDYSYVIPWLSSQGFICNEIQCENFAEDLKRAYHYGDLLLVLGSSEFSLSDCLAIERYMHSGKKLLFALSPYSADIEGSWRITKAENRTLLDMLDSYGVHFSDDLILDLSCARIIMESENDGLDAGVYTRQINYFQWINLLPQTNAKEGLVLFWPTELLLEVSEENDFSHPLLYSSSSSYTMRPDENSPTSLFETNPFLLEKAGFNPEKQSLSPKVVAAEFSTDSDIRFDVISDQYFVNSLMMGYSGGTYGDFRNLNFLVNRLLRLGGEEHIAALQEKFALSSKNFLYKTTDVLDFVSAKNKTIAFLFVVEPLLLVVGGISMGIFRRKRVARGKMAQLIKDEAIQ